MVARENDESRLQGATREAYQRTWVANSMAFEDVRTPGVNKSIRSLTISQTRNDGMPMDRSTSEDLEQTQHNVASIYFTKSQYLRTGPGTVSNVYVTRRTLHKSTNPGLP